MRKSFTPRPNRTSPAAQGRKGSAPSTNAPEKLHDDGDDHLPRSREVDFGSYPRRAQIRMLNDLAWCEAIDADRHLLTVKPPRLDDRWVRNLGGGLL